MPAPYISEIKYRGSGSLDFVEVALDAGTSTANIQIVIYNPSGTVRTTNTLGTLDNTIAGTDIYVIDAATSGTFNGLHANGAVALVVNGTVVAFHSFNTTVTATAGPANGMTSGIVGTTGTGGSLESTDGVNYTATGTPTPSVVPCFVTGTLVQTPEGLLPVETLKSGDSVLTLDNGPQQLLWAGRRDVTKAERSAPENATILIPSEAFGPSCPTHSLLVSRNHRIALSGPTIELLYGVPEVLVAAKNMVGKAGVRSVSLPRGLAYHHLLFENHEIVLSNGMASESLHLGQIALLGFEPKVRRALHNHFGDTFKSATARMVLTALEAQTAIRCFTSQGLTAHDTVAA